MRTDRLLGVTLLVLLAGLVAAPGASAVLSTPENLLLDTYRADPKKERPGTTGSVKTTEPLASGGFYIVEATGTYSRYLRPLMNNETRPKLRRCGTPEPAPLFPSPGVLKVAPAGIDPEWAFSYVVADTGPSPCPVPVVRPIGAFQMDLGAGFRHVIADNRGTGPRADHTYRYTVQGTGGPAAFRYTDDPLGDNNGVISIRIRPATTTDCAANQTCQESVNNGTTPPVTGDGGTAQAAANEVIATTNSACVSRRRFRIRLVDNRKDPIVAATVRVNGKTVAVAKAKVGGRNRRVAFIDLRGLPGKRFTVSITAKTRSGKVRRGTRKYFTCKPKRDGGRPRL